MPEPKICPMMSTFVEEYTNTVNLGVPPKEFREVECRGERCQLWWQCKNPEPYIFEGMPHWVKDDDIGDFWQKGTFSSPGTPDEDGCWHNTSGGTTEPQ